MMTAYDFVPDGPAVHDSPGKMLPRYCVFSNGMSPPALKAGVVTVNFAPPLAGTVTDASSAAPTSAAGGGCWAKRAGAPVAVNMAAKAIRIEIFIEVDAPSASELGERRNWRRSILVARCVSRGFAAQLRHGHWPRAWAFGDLPLVGEVEPDNDRFDHDVCVAAIRLGDRSQDSATTFYIATV